MFSYLAYLRDLITFVINSDISSFNVSGINKGQLTPYEFLLWKSTALMTALYIRLFMQICFQSIFIIFLSVE